jgi:hypothetical protein
LDTFANSIRKTLAIHATRRSLVVETYHVWMMSVPAGTVAYRPQEVIKRHVIRIIRAILGSRVCRIKRRSFIAIRRGYINVVVRQADRTNHAVLVEHAMPGFRARRFPRITSANATFRRVVFLREIRKKHVPAIRDLSVSTWGHRIPTIAVVYSNAVSDRAIMANLVMPTEHAMER